MTDYIDPAEYLRKFMSFIKVLFRYSGLEFIYRKFNPLKENIPLPTGTIWAVGIYVALFSISSDRYENRLDIIESRVNSIFVQLTTEHYKNALSRIATVQRMPCPEKPIIFYPLTVFRSLLSDSVNQDVNQLLISTIEDWKHNLDDVDLEGANLQGADLSNTVFNNTNFKYANLTRANFKGSTLNMTCLDNANLEDADFSRANLEQAWNYKGIENTETYRNPVHEYYKEKQKIRNLSGLDRRVREIDLQFSGNRPRLLEQTEQLCKAYHLSDSILKPELRKEIEQKCSSLLRRDRWVFIRVSE